jgi:hypothetical protein
MEVMRKSLIAVLGVASLIVSACASPPPKPMTLQACLHDATVLPDLSQRSPAIQQCRVNWPQPWPAAFASAP